MNGQNASGYYSIGQTVSNAESLLQDAKTSGHGAPTHTPNVATQDYTDVDSGAVHNYWGGSWHP